MKEKIFNIIQIGDKSNRISRAFDIFITFTIICNIIVTFLETFDQLASFGGLFTMLEHASVLIFCIEYALRIWTADYLYPEKTPGRARFCFLISFDGVVDLLTIIPVFFLSGFIIFRMLRVARIFHLFRLNAKYDSFNIITTVLYEKRNQIISSVFIVMVLMLASSMCMYSVEHNAQPDIFRNAFSGIWWSMSTLLTVGYGDIYPVTTLGRVMAICIAYLGVGAVAIPTGIISAGFVEQYQRKSSLSSMKDADIQEIAEVFVDKRYAGKTIEEMEHNYEGYNGAVRFLMKAGIPGIKGVVADLMKVPSGMEVAVETALGAGMQNIVCGKDADAKKAINELKTNKAGRLTFLPLESIHGNPANVPQSVRQDAGFKGLACDLIEYDKAYEGIFKYLLGRVAVVDNMDTAVRLSKTGGGGIRFVTPDGEIINASGAITGGKYKNATANLLARKTEISTLESEIKRLTRTYNENKDKIESLKAEADALLKNCADSEEKARKLELLVLESETRLKALEDNYKDTKESNAKKERELESIENDFVNLAQTEATLLREADEADAEIKRLDEETTELMESFEEIKLQTQNAGEEITKARIARTECDSKFEAAGRMLERVGASVDEIQAQIEAKQMSLEALEKEKSEILFGSENSEDNYRSKLEEKTRLEEYIAEIASEKAQLSSDLGERTTEFAEIGDKLNSYQDRKYQIEIKLAKNETQMDTWKEKLWEEFEISYAQAVSMKKDDFVLSTATRESREIKNRMKELGDVNIGAIKEYEQISTRYEFLTEQRSDILEAMQELQSIISDMDKTIKTKFKENFDQVVVNFEEIFKELFGGGHAELTLDNEDNPLESGIDIIAQPPGKKLQNINLMSGGEKTMTAIALMFAVLKTKPTPFCILDEVEAALDDNNIDRFARYLRRFDGIQFAIVTHQKATMEHADVLYGVTMPEQGISKVLSLRLGDDFDI